MEKEVVNSLEDKVKIGVRYGFRIPLNEGPSFDEFYTFLYSSLARFETEEKFDRDNVKIRRLKDVIRRDSKEGTLYVRIGLKYNLEINISWINGEGLDGYILFKERIGVDSSNDETGLVAKVFNIFLDSGYNKWGIDFLGID